MENLKKNLHLVVFAVGVLIGIVLLFVGMSIRGGKEEELAASQTGLDGQASVQTKGTLDSEKSKAASFVETLEEAKRALSQGNGVAFTADYKQHNSGGEFYTNEANGKLLELKMRFERMNKPVRLPDLLSDYTLRQSAADGSKTFWDQLEKEMANPPKDRIRDFQMRLRLMHEVVTTCEHLIEQGADGGFGVAITAMKFDEFGPSQNSPVDSPYMAMPCQVNLTCTPSFAVLLTAELGNQTGRTIGPTKKTEKDKEDPKKFVDGHSRLGFPVILDLMQTEMMERMSEVRLHIKNNDKPGMLDAVNAKLKQLHDEGDSDNETLVQLDKPADLGQLDPESGVGKLLVDHVTEILNNKDVFEFPVRVALKMRAASFNNDWAGVAEPEEQ